MIKQFVACFVASTISLACLGLLAACLAKDTIKDIDVGPSDN